MSSLLKRARGRPRLKETREINDIRLIEEIKKFSIFYDREHPHYRSRKYTERAWHNVAHNLKTTVGGIKIRMLQLRNRYNVEKRRSALLGRQQPEVVSNWPLYDNLRFLREFNEKCDGISKKNGSQKNIEVIGIGYNVTQDEDEEKEVENKEEPNISSANDNSDYIVADNNYQMPEFEMVQCPPSLEIQEYYPPVALNASFNPNDVLNETKFDFFGKFLASSLIEMNEIQASHLLKKITSDLVEYSKLAEVIKTED